MTDEKKPKPSPPPNRDPKPLERERPEPRNVPLRDADEGVKVPHIDGDPWKRK